MNICPFAHDNNPPQGNHIAIDNGRPGENDGSTNGHNILFDRSVDRDLTSQNEYVPYFHVLFNGHIIVNFYDTGRLCMDCRRITQQCQ